MSVAPASIPASLWRDPASVLALGLGAGALPGAPGTWGTLVAVPVYLLLQSLSLIEYLMVVALLFIVGVWWCGRAARLLGVHDHPAIVWDEMVGYWATMAVAPQGWGWLVSGFVLFRLFDIWKPWPIRRLDRQISGGLGIMLDDLAAGVYAALCLYTGTLVFAPG